MNNTVNRASLGAKKNNLIKRLWTDNHEKQSPQRFARYAAMLIMFLTLGVGQMWADWYISGWESLTGHDWGTHDDCKIVSNTVTFSEKGAAAYQFKLTDGSSWYGHNQFTGAYGAASRTSESGWDNAQLTTTWKSDITFTYDGNGSYNYSAYAVPVLYIAGNGTADSNGNWCDGKNWNPDSHLLSKTATAGKYTVTFEDVAAGDYQFKITDGTWSYVLNSDKMSNSSPTNVTLTSSGANDYNICFTLSGTADVTVLVDITSGSNVSGWKVYVTVKYSGLSVAASPAAGGSPTISATTVNLGSSVTVHGHKNTGYDFSSWSSDDGSFGNASNEETTFTPTANDAVATATYTPSVYDITYLDKGGSSFSGSNSASLPGTYTYGTGIATLTDGIKSGYRFDGWYGNSSCTGDAITSISSSATGDKTFYAKWTENPGGTISLIAGTGGQVSKDNSSWSSSTSYSGIKTTDDLNIYARANTGYSFSSWSKTSGSGTITSTSSVSTTFTPVANEDATVTASFTENSYTITIVGGTAGSTTAKVVTTGSATANPPFGKYFINWTVPESNFSFTGGTSATDATITFNATADGTVTANFGDLYAFVEGRFRIFDAATNSTPTYTATDNGYWGESSTNIQFSYDNTNHQFYLSTYATPKQLADELNSNEQYFYIKTSSSDDDLTDVHIYRPASGATDSYKKLTTAGTKLNAPKDPAGSSHSYWFDSSDDTGYAKLHFDGSKIWYSLEQTLQYDGNGSDGGSAPASKTYYDKGATAKAASNSYTKSGYTFTGWNTAPGGGGTSYAANANITMNSNITLYAQWQENQYNTTVEISPDGSGTTSPSAGTVAIKQVTGTSIEATKGTNTVFEDWSVTGGGLTMVSSSTTNPNTFKATSTGGTIRANFTSQWTVAGSMYNTWAWDKTSNLLTDYETISTKTYAYVTMSDLDPNTSYTLKVKDRNEDQDHGWYGIPDESEDDIFYADGDIYKDVTNETGNQDIVLHTAAAGDYIFKFNVTDKKLAIEYPTSWYITSGVMTEYNDGGSSDATETGGTFTAVDNSSNNVKGGKFVANGASVTFEAGEKDGYTFDAWYTNEGCTTGKTTTNPLTVSSIDADVTRYAKFTENMTTVTLTATNGKIQYWTGSAWADAPSSESVGVHTTCSIKAVPNSGYYFAGWVKTEGSDYSITGSFESESNNNTTLSGKGGGSASGQTLTANFVELDKIYFRNLSTMDDGAWDNVYVYFGVTWNGYANAVTNASASYKATMTQIGETDVYWAYVPRAFTTSGGTAIAFADYSVGTSATINTAGKLAASRNDYNRALQMYVPSVTWDDHGAHYYNSGYWKNYPVKAATGAGYYLQTTRGENLVEFTGQADNSDIIECTVRVDDHDRDKTFHIKSAGGIYFEQYDYDKEEYPKITSTASTMTMKSGDTDGLIVTLTSEGDYKFILDQSSDVMELTVVYPVGVGDYRIKHSYSDSGTKYAYSDIIKSSESHPTVSMYYNPSSATIVLQKCTLVNASGPQWNAGTAIEKTKLNKGAGVYQFDLTISADAGTIDDGAGLYDGPFYIKTDCAPGGWADYTRNVMETNTITAEQFDYYHVTNASSGSNVKFVIANQYSNAISDTIVADATYLTTSKGGSSKEYMPSDGCVRFMYNSATNTASRAYMQYSSNNNFLNVKPTAASKVYLESGGSTDLYSASDANTKIGEDDGNYVYRKTVYAVPGAIANIKATFNGDAQTLVSSRTLMGGTGSDKYPITLVYDFKTNYLMAAWQPSASPITAALENVEFMYIREGQETSNQISFSGSGQFTNPKVYGVFQFDQEDYKNKVGAWPEQDGQEDGYTNKMCMFYFSFPFDVKVNDIYGVGTYGTEWKIQYYDGAERASKGFFRGDGTTTFWKDMPLDGELKAYVGYSLLLDNDYFNGTLGSIWDMNPTSVYLYFPSKESISNVSEGDIEITVPAHECTIDRTFEGGTKNHMITDSHWNMVGVPLFRDQTGNFTSYFKQEDLSYLYAWNPATNTLGVAEAVNSFTFKAMYAYMVQYEGKITFSGSRIPSSVAARRATQEGNYKIDLSVIDNENEFLNRTYVELREEASENFMLNEDLCMELNSRDVNIYSFAGDYDVAANVLPMSNQTVRLGLNVKKNGTYKLSMPSNFTGTATLIDTETNQRTNLGFGDYEVYLTKGNYNNRFVLDINIYKTPTAIDGVDGGSLKDGKAHKFIENGQMFILRDGRIYDATGVLVK